MSENGDIMPPKLLRWYLSNILRKIEELDKIVNDLKMEVYYGKEKSKQEEGEDLSDKADIEVKK